MASFLRNTFDNLVNNINSSLSANQNATPTRPNRTTRNTTRSAQSNSTPEPRSNPTTRSANSRPASNTASDYIRIIRRNIAPFSGTNSRANEQGARSSSQPPPGRHHHRHHHDTSCPAHRHYHQHRQHQTQTQNQPQPPPPPQNNQQLSDNNMASNMSQNTVPAQEKLDISDVRDPSDINTLSAKQLKIILTRNCVDYKGIFEKEVLREKVLQLWIDCNEKKYNKNSDQNNTFGGNDGSQRNSDDIDDSQACKICMEREINCVLLECGHMLTCVPCGRKLAECPVCRQNVSRCVRTFKG